MQVSDSDLLPASTTSCAHIPSWNFQSYDGIAEVKPEHKHGVVCALQRAGYVVGMTGDGVNDAPALAQVRSDGIAIIVMSITLPLSPQLPHASGAQADVGIAVLSATDIAKAAAGVVLTESGLSRIAILIEVSRTVHTRMLTYLINKCAKELFQVHCVPGSSIDYCVCSINRSQTIRRAYSLLLRTLPLACSSFRRSTLCAFCFWSTSLHSQLQPTLSAGQRNRHRGSLERPCSWVSCSGGSASQSPSGQFCSSHTKPDTTRLTLLSCKR